MSLTLYNNIYQRYFIDSKKVDDDINICVKLLKKTQRLYFIGNGGSNAICSHMANDFNKNAKLFSLSFTDSATVSCFTNDFGTDNSITEWLKLHFTNNDVLIAISSSGESNNIINACSYAKQCGATIITLSGFEANNRLAQLGTVNFHVPANQFGIVECFHQIILHAILDEYVNQL